MAAIAPKIGRMSGKLDANPDPLPTAINTPRMTLHAVPTTRTMRPERRDLRIVGPRYDRPPALLAGSSTRPAVFRFI